MTKSRFLLLTVALLLSACARAEPHPVQVASALPVEPLPTGTDLPPTATPPLPTGTSGPAPTQDPALFGAVGTGEIQAFALESVANAIFVEVMDGFKANGSIQDYQVTSVTVFPGGDGLLSEIIYNIQTADPAWLADGGTQFANGWIQGNCSRFDFVTTEMEYQLKNRRLCG